MQLFNYTLDQFSRRMATVGLESNVTVTSVAPVDGYTLEAQLRDLVAAQPPASAEAPTTSASEPPPAVSSGPSMRCVA